VSCSEIELINQLRLWAELKTYIFGHWVWYTCYFTFANTLPFQHSLSTLNLLVITSKFHISAIFVTADDNQYFVICTCCWYQYHIWNCHQTKSSKTVFEQLCSYHVIILHFTKNDFNCICIFFKDLPHIISGLFNWSVTSVILSHKFINSAWYNKFYSHMHNIMYTTNVCFMCTF